MTSETSVEVFLFYHYCNSFSSYDIVMSNRGKFVAIQVQWTSVRCVCALWPHLDWSETTVLEQCQSVRSHLPLVFQTERVDEI